MAQIPLGQRIHPVVMLAGVHRIGHQHRVINRGNVDIKTRENLGVVLRVLADLDDRWVFKHRLEHRQTFIKAHLTSGHFI